MLSYAHCNKTAQLRLSVKTISFIFSYNPFILYYHIAIMKATFFCSVKHKLYQLIHHCLPDSPFILFFYFVLQKSYNFRIGYRIKIYHILPKIIRYFYSPSFPFTLFAGKSLIQRSGNLPPYFFDLHLILHIFRIVRSNLLHLYTTLTSLKEPGIGKRQLQNRLR